MQVLCWFLYRIIRPGSKRVESSFHLVSREGDQETQDTDTEYCTVSRSRWRTGRSMGELRVSVY